MSDVPRGAPGCTCGSSPFAPPEPSEDCPFHGNTTIDQLVVDDVTLYYIREHCLHHPDVYPFALQVVNMALRASIESPSIGTEERAMLICIHDIIHRNVKDNDPMSADFFDKGIRECPR